jgi:hypothetical protein
MAHPVVYDGDLKALLETYKEKHAGRDHECVALPQAVTNVGHTSRWRPGDKVVDLNILTAGTVIANFKFEKKKVRFPNEHGYHAAIFLEFGNRNMATGGYTHFWVIDQWPGKPVKRRNKNSFTPDEVKRKGILPADNANEYYVVMVP